MTTQSQPREKSEAKPAAVADVLSSRDVDGEALLAALPHPILVIGTGDHILFANAAAESFFSMSASTLEARRACATSSPSVVRCSA